MTIDDDEGYWNKVMRETPAIPIKTYSEEQHNKDICEFAEWCSVSGWKYDGNDYHKWFHLKFGFKTTSQLQEMWEIETGRRKA